MIPHLSSFPSYMLFIGYLWLISDELDLPVFMWASFCRTAACWDMTAWAFGVWMYELTRYVFILLDYLIMRKTYLGEKHL